MMSASMILLQWRNRLQRQMLPRQNPILLQRFAVRGGPFGHEPAYSRRQIPLDDHQAVDRHNGSLPTVTNMKVRRRMIIIMHRDDDAVEAREFRHPRRSTEKRDACSPP